MADSEVYTRRSFPYAVRPPRVVRSSQDIYRSLKKQVAVILGDAWDVRLVEEEGTFSRPSALVIPTGVASTSDDSQFFAMMVQPFGVYAYPEIGASASESRLASLEVEEILLDGLAFGVGKGGPRRIPLYSYDGVDLLSAAVERGYADFARITDLSVGSIPDPNDRTLWTVTCEIRLSWRRVPHLTSAPGPVVKTVTAEPGP